MADALDTPVSRIRRANGAYSIEGRFGRVYVVSDDPLLRFQIVIGGVQAPWTTARGWNICKRDMATFAKLTQDAHDEGAFELDRLPTPEEADKIRKWLGLRRKRVLTKEQLAELRGRMERARAHR